MSDPKSFASLNPTLLARKGGAKPAMRSQLAMNMMQEATARQFEDDLGWNDMGQEPEEPMGEVVAFNPQAAIAQAEVPEVVRQQEEIAERVVRPAKSASPAQSRRSALADGRRAAFTLRLDAERHLKLRLACTISNRSAQQMVIDALDRLIAELPDVASLAAQVSKSR